MLGRTKEGRRHYGATNLIVNMDRRKWHPDRISPPALDASDLTHEASRIGLHLGHPLRVATHSIRDKVERALHPWKSRLLFATGCVMN
ncbi:hypothetical protein QJS10_CPB15g01817 [Acorus calamus]|uniref:Uncharacterized protein n=1 Tax=Acorus calamus TaxID=4465 RepID=A0AAV9D5B4_ACOCL|nr:hypothetical protein QJS10_CPB15g01817 [Acorus calamus]